MKNRKCPNHKNCLDYLCGACEDCGLGIEIIKLHKKIERLKKQNEELTIQRNAFALTIERLSSRLTPKKPEMKAMDGFDPEVASELCCPECGGPVTNYWVRGAKPMHCQFCGQAIYWGEEVPEE